MNLIRFLVFASVASIACGADLTLTDGRVFRDYRIVSQTASTVMIRYAKGAAKVEKQLLPPEILSQYPIDQEAVAAEAKAKEAEAAKAALRDQEAKKRQKEENDAFMKQQMERLHPTDTVEAITELVRQRVDRYVKTERKSPWAGYTADINVTADTPRAVDGWDRRYEVTGVAWWQFFDSHGASFGADKTWFRVDIRPDRNGQLRVMDFAALSSDPNR